MEKEKIISDIKAGKGVSEKLQDEIAKEQLEDSMNLTREQWLEERKQGIGRFRLCDNNGLKSI